MIRLFTILALFFVGTVGLYAQSGELSGKVVDEKGEGVPFATVAVEKNGSLVTGGKTDFDGYFTIKPLAPGNYDVKISSVGFSGYLNKGVAIGSDKITELPTVKLKIESTALATVEVIDYKVPLIEKDGGPTKNTITQEEIKNLPTRSVASIASQAAGVFQSDEGGDLSIRGARTDATEYFVDGVRVTGSSAPNLPPQSIEQIQVLTGGIPAKYGDAAGGVVNITTRGPSNKLTGSIGGITSQGMDPVGYNDINFNLTGPIWTKYRGTDSADTKIGFFIAGEYLHTNDGSPSSIGYYRLSDNALANLEQNPLLKSTVSTAFLPAASAITKDSLIHINSKMNAASSLFTGAGKLDFKITDNIDVTVGGNADFTKHYDPILQYSLMNWVNNRMLQDLSWRTFVRFTQRFGKQGGSDKDAPKSAFQNAYYSIQFDYQNDYSTQESDRHGFNPFTYGYLGKYDVKTAPVYQSDTVHVGNQVFTGHIQKGTADTLVTFTPGTLNPTSTQYVNKYYQLAGADTNAYYRNTNQILLNGGLLNGMEPPEVYGLWYQTGRSYRAYGVDKNNDQYRLSIQGSVDIQRPGSVNRNKHSLEFGIEFEQRVERNYSVTAISSGGVGLWEIMRQSTNSHLQNLDKANPKLLINGKVYDYNDPNRPAFTYNDTIKYNPLYIDSQQTYFDKNLRQKLGLPVNGTDIINIDALDPSVFSLSMFNADELLNNGNKIVSYAGYNYLGQKNSSNPSFNDFFTQKDKNGQYTRPIGAFMPVYTAGYLQDKFNFKDLLFNVGVRIDRYDANTQVLKDPYSLYKVLSVAEAQQIWSQRGSTASDAKSYSVPASMGSNYSVYVDQTDNGGQGTSAPKPVGYRNGDQWYDANGIPTSDPSIIARASNTGGITPFLDHNLVNNIKDSMYNPNQSFRSYTPQINVMPRVSMSFNVTDEALFYAHYDILTQRPNEGTTRITPDQYYFFDQAAVAGPLNNPNLRPIRTIDYEVGFRQKVSDNSAITISSFYRELRDNIQIRNFTYAYPLSYQGYDNIDFGTVKGFSFGYDMRWKKTTNLSLKVNYTIQFADGTGSSTTSQQSLIGNGQPNLRVVAPFDYDARHTINVSADYRFREGKDYTGPKINGHNILENFGINLGIRARSGTPYTPVSSAYQTVEDGVSTRPVSIGDLNGSRIPWTFRVDLKVDKSFNITGKKKDSQAAPGKMPRQYYVNVYILIQNLFNTQNVLSVYRYTGNANDDGYLASPNGIQETKGYLYPQAFSDLYKIKVADPSKYSLPRQIRIGAEFDF